MLSVALVLKSQLPRTQQVRQIYLPITVSMSCITSTRSLTGTCTVSSGKVHGVHTGVHFPAKRLYRNHKPAKTTTCLLLLLLSGDVEMNPGPNSFFPCGCCELDVSWNMKAVLCDQCSAWYHKSCLDMCSAEYNRHVSEGSGVIWICNVCDSKNYDSSMLRSYHLVDTSNYYSILEQTSLANLSHISSPGSVFSPRHTSSPKLNGNRSPSDGQGPAPMLSKGRNWRSLIVNVNGIRDKGAELETAIEYIKPDVIIACESKLSDKVLNSEFLPKAYQQDVFRKDRSDHGGGVFLAFREGHSVSEVKMPHSTSESIWAKVSTSDNKQPIYVCSFYRPPGTGADPIHDLNNSTAELTSKGLKNIIIGGDFNCGFIDWNSESVVPNARERDANESLLKMLVDHSLSNTQHAPTRENSILDLHITSNPSLVKSQTVTPGISDHEMVVIDSDIRPNFTKKEPRKVYSYKKANWEKICDETTHFRDDFLNTAPSRDVNSNWEIFKEHLQGMQDKHIPSRMSSTRHNLPWVTKSIRRQIKKKQASFMKARATKKPADWAAYKRLKKASQYAVRKSHYSYIRDTLTQSMEEGNSKTFWSYVKAKRQDSCGIAPLMKDGNLYSLNKDKAEILNDQFTSVFTKDKLDPIPEMEGGKAPSIPDVIVDANGVCKLLQKLQISKACGPDGIKNILLKELATVIAPVLAFIFQQSLDSGHLPPDWRDANIAPVFKKGDRNMPANYRPVSLTCVCAKTLEHIVVSQIMKHLERHSILTDLQHGFRGGFSCVSQLITTTVDLLGYHDLNLQTDMAILDFSKAFDVVSHRKLLAKLDHYGIRGQVGGWINGFLTNRTQRVVVNGAQSNAASVKSGVPQGTCLGPILFLCYINDIVEGITSQLRLFADDLLIYLPIRTEADHHTLQDDLTKLEQWANKWDMKFNPKKCYILSTGRNKTSSYFYSLCGTVLQSVSNNPYLGVILSDDLSFSRHISTTVAKASRTLGFLSRNLKACPPRLKATAYITLCRSTLEYAAAVWDPKPNSNDEKALEKVQRRAARFVSRDYRRTSSVTALLRKLEWEPLSSRRRNIRLALLYQILHSETAISPDHFQPGLRGRIKQLRCKYDLSRQSFVPNTIRDWNALPQTSKEAASAEAFRAGLPKASY